jgi:hypothetical protein
MPRRIQDLQASIQSTEERIKALDNTPLKPIGDLLIDAIRTSSMEQKPDVIEPVLDYVIYVLNRFPELNKRFYFDAYLIRSISDLWNQGKIYCSNILPSYKNIWAHQIVQLPYIGKKGSLTNSTELRLIDLIYFRKKYAGEQPNLIDYPWLFHEMGHYLISRYGKILFASLTPIIDKLISTLHLRALADRDVAKARAKNTIDEITRMWSPASNFSQWTYEIAIDVVGLWSCGPAYLYSFYADHQDVNPFLIEPYHPPVVIRTYTLIESAKIIGWGDYTKPLISALKIWDRKIPDLAYNRYKTLRDKGLIDSYIKKACEYYSDLGIPRLENQDIDRISSQVIDVDSPTLTADLVVKAWLVYQEKGDTAYQAWEENVVNEITELVIP